MLDCIDAGHHGTSVGLDCGAVGKFSKEANITLRFAKLLGEKLKSRGGKVVYTREGNVKQTTYQKSEIGNKAKASRFISIHCNSYKDPNSNGVETYICKGAKDETLELAKRVQAALVKSSGLRDRGVKEANYDVLVKTNMPAILIELGFISNLNEEKLLNDDSWLERVATSVCDALVGKKEDHIENGVPLKDDEVRVVVGNKTSVGKLIDGTTYVPARFVGESLNKEVVYDAKTKTVTIK